MPDIPQPIRRGALSASRTLGRLTAGARMTPSFLIVGAKRAGTTSMYQSVVGHPQVMSAVLLKEVHYFDTHYQQGWAWYQGHFPTKLNAAIRARRIGLPMITGEATPYYMWHPLSPARIQADLPEVRLIVLVRDPVQRAYSEHAHGVTGGWETERSFERALELEGERIAGERERLIADPTYHSVHYAHHAYLQRGHYIEQLETMEAVFGRDRIHVIDSDALFDDAGPAMAGLFSFLRLSEWAVPRLHNLNARPRSRLTPELSERLAAHFEPADQRLADWLGWTPSWRR